jgi:transposase
MLARYGPASAEQALGALPVVAGFCRRLDIAGIIDRAVPVRCVARATHGQVIEALIANRLTSPSPMVHVGAWARQFAVSYVLGLAPDVLNDDRIARALDALAPVLEQVTGSVGAAAIAAYGIDVSQLHWDMTSVSLHGAYEQAEEGYPQPGFGHPKDRRTDLKQIQAGAAAAADGAVPVFWQPYGGGAGEVSQVTGAMEALRRLAGPRRFLLVGDSKLLSYANIAAMITAEVHFLAPASKAFVPAHVLAGCDYGAAAPAGYVAGRDAARPAGQRGGYRVTEDTMTITGPRRNDPAYTLRRVFVHSTARAGAAAAARSKKLHRAAGDLARLARGLGSRHYNTAEKVTARISAIARERRVGDYLRADVGTGPRGRPTLAWHFDQAAIDAEAATDGWYALLTNLPADLTAGQVLARYKNQPATSERRYHDLKGPLAVAPMFLHANRRITAIIGIICMALLIYCLAERQARRNLAPAIRLDGLYRPARQAHRQPDLHRALNAAPADNQRRHARDTPAGPHPAAPARTARNRPQAAGRPTQPHVRITGLASGASSPKSVPWLRRGRA